MEESIGTDTFAKYFQKDLPIRCQKLQQERIIFRTKNKKTSRCLRENIEKFLEVYADDLTNMLQRDYKL